MKHLMVSATGWDTMNKTIVVDRERHPYTYRVPTPDDVKPLSRYAGKSLEEIRKQYGDEEAQAVYTMAAQCGVDQTKPEPIYWPDLKYDICVDYEWVYEDDTKVYALTLHGNGKDTVLLRVLAFDLDDGMKKFGARLVRDYIERN